MLLFRLADLPRRVRRLTPALPLDATEIEGRAAPAVVGWTLLPALLDGADRRAQARLRRVLALYKEAEGQPRSAVEALAPRLEEIIGDYRLARCLAHTIEDAAYEFVPPPSALPQEPPVLRALCYRRAQEWHNGYVPRAQRAAFLAATAAELDTTPERLDAALWADRAGAALLRRKTDAGADPAEDTLHPARLIARYNAAAVATVLAASSWVTLRLAASETAALKDLYRHARALHVGVDITQGATSDELELRLYGPGSRALVRSRAALADKPAQAQGSGGASTAGDGLLVDDAGDDGQDPAEEWRGDAGGEAADLRVPAAGGGPVAAVVTRLLRRHASAVQGGWTRLLGPDRRLLHVALEGQLLAALRGDVAEMVDAMAVDVQYDSAVEEEFARAFHAHEAAGRGGLVRGWRLRREPRIVLAGDSVFLPDFDLRRGDVEVYGEVIGYYTEDYLTRKTRKLAALRGQIPLLLIVDQDLAPIFHEIGFPLVTYKAGRRINVAEVITVLETAFDPFTRRYDHARAVLAGLCATAGPDISEEELSVATGCAGRSELLTLWAELLANVAAQPDDTVATRQPRRVAESAPPYGVDDAADDWPRRYLPGYGLIQGHALAAARTALTRLLHEAGGPVALADALACVGQAGVPDPDEVLLERLGAVVARAGLFAEARVYSPGAAADGAMGTLAMPASADPPGKRRRRQRAAPSERDGAGQHDRRPTTIADRE